MCNLGRYVAVEDVNAAEQLQLDVVRDLELELVLDRASTAAHAGDAVRGHSRKLGVVRKEGKRPGSITTVHGRNELAVACYILGIVGVCRRRPELGQADQDHEG